MDTNGLLPCTIGVPFFSPLLQTPSALTLVLPPSVFEMPSVSWQNLNDHVQGSIATKHYSSCAAQWCTVRSLKTTAKITAMLK